VAGQGCAGGPFQFKAGQYATLGVDYDGKRIERAYSIVSSPYEQDWLEFFIELVPQGELTPHLINCILATNCCAAKLPRGDLHWICGVGAPNTCCWLR
jgi:ferredoxin-NADP reductase